MNKFDEKILRFAHTGDRKDLEDAFKTIPHKTGDPFHEAVMQRYANAFAKVQVPSKEE